ncbi:MAG: alpha/beta fold hydrolase [Solirubrobacterales bacterium]
MATEELDPGPRAVSYPYKRIKRPSPTPPEGPDPYGNPDARWLEIDWCERLRWISVDGDRVNYVDYGEGEPIVCIHGLGGVWQNWLENIAPLADAGHRVLALDLPGFGASPMPDWDLTIPNYAELVAGFCTELGLSGSTLVGNSMGGFIAAEVELRIPEWNDRLVLVSAAGISHAEMRREPVLAAGRLMAALSPLILRINERAIRRPGLRELAFEGFVRHPDKLRKELLWELSVPATGAPGWFGALAGLTGYDFRDRLERISDPTLIIWGRDDRIVPAVDASGYAEHLPEAELVIFDDCGHAPMLEHPVRFNRLLQTFVERRR